MTSTKKSFVSDNMARSRPEVERILREKAGYASSFHPQQAPHRVLYIHGVVPCGEQPRSSVGACRRAVRQILRKELIFQRRYCGSGRGGPLVSSLARWRALNNIPLNRLITQFEQAGVIEYRPAYQVNMGVPTWAQ